jgi:hypothetical protein
MIGSWWSQVIGQLGSFHVSQIKSIQTTLRDNLIFVYDIFSKTLPVIAPKQ